MELAGRKIGRCPDADPDHVREDMGKGGSMSRTGWIWAVLVAFLPVATLADVEGDLRAELVGRYALARGELVSECTDHFTDMKVVGGRLTGGIGMRFETRRAAADRQRQRRRALRARRQPDARRAVPAVVRGRPVHRLRPAPLPRAAQLRGRSRDVRKDRAKSLRRGRRRARPLRRRRRGEARRLEPAQGRALSRRTGRRRSASTRPGSSPR